MEERVRDNERGKGRRKIWPHTLNAYVKMSENPLFYTENI